MSAPTLYLYNLDTPRGAKIRRMCLPLGIRTKLVPPQAHQVTLQQMIDGQFPAEGEAAFQDEMLLLAEFTSAQVDALLLGFRRARIAPVALKAVLTPTNQDWSSVQLLEELDKERQAIQQGGQAEHDTASME